MLQRPEEQQLNASVLDALYGYIPNERDSETHTVISCGDLYYWGFGRLQ
jgi:hypothetical protein